MDKLTTFLFRLFVSVAILVVSVLLYRLIDAVQLEVYYQKQIIQRMDDLQDTIGDAAADIEVAASDASLQSYPCGYLFLSAGKMYALAGNKEAAEHAIRRGSYELANEASREEAKNAAKRTAFFALLDVMDLAEDNGVPHEQLALAAAQLAAIRGDVKQAEACVQRASRSTLEKIDKVIADVPK